MAGWQMMEDCLLRVSDDGWIHLFLAQKIMGKGMAFLVGLPVNLSYL